MDCLITGEAERTNPKGAEYGNFDYWVDQLLSLFNSELERREEIFTEAEIYQLKSYVIERDLGENDGWYEGNREQFEKRHKSILAKLDDILSLFKGKE